MPTPIAIVSGPYLGQPSRFLSGEPTTSAVKPFGRRLFREFDQLVVEFLPEWSVKRRDALSVEDRTKSVALLFDPVSKFGRTHPTKLHDQTGSASFDLDVLAHDPSIFEVYRDANDERAVPEFMTALPAAF